MHTSMYYVQFPGPPSGPPAHRDEGQPPRPGSEAPGPTKAGPHGHTTAAVNTGRRGRRMLGRRAKAGRTDGEGKGGYCEWGRGMLVMMTRERGREGNERRRTRRNGDQRRRTRQSRERKQMGQRPTAERRINTGAHGDDRNERGLSPRKRITNAGAHGEGKREREGTGPQGTDETEKGRNGRGLCPRYTDGKPTPAPAANAPQNRRGRGRERGPAPQRLL